MKLHYLSPGEEVPIRDVMQPDMVYLHRAPKTLGSEASLRVELYRYKGGLANQQEAQL
jgi:hypothetical protein